MFDTKNYLYLLVVLCFMTTSLSFAQNQPQISFDYTNFDAGEVWEGDKVSHTFIVKNTGAAQLDISKVRPG